METSAIYPRTLWTDGTRLSGSRRLAEETPVAISYNGSTHAVLMATPADLEDLAVGFSLTEGIIAGLGDIESIDIVAYDLGLDVQVRVEHAIADRLARRRRTMAGPVGCGLCGIESLHEAARVLPTVEVAVRFSSSDITAAMHSLEGMQTVNAATSSVHAAGFFLPGAAVSVAREDVGRHNALDKLIGALVRGRVAPSEGGFVVTSRVSLELVQKVAMAGSGLLAAISAPTALAVRTAEAAGISLAAVVRGANFETFSRPERIVPEPVAHVA